MNAVENVLAPLWTWGSLCFPQWTCEPVGQDNSYETLFSGQVDGHQDDDESNEPSCLVVESHTRRQCAFSRHLRLVVREPVTKKIEFESPENQLKQQGQVLATHLLSGSWHAKVHDIQVTSRFVQHLYWSDVFHELHLGYCDVTGCMWYFSVHYSIRCVPCAHTTLHNITHTHTHTHTQWTLSHHFSMSWMWDFIGWRGTNSSITLSTYWWPSSGHSTWKIFMYVKPPHDWLEPLYHVSQRQRLTLLSENPMIQHILSNTSGVLPVRVCVQNAHHGWCGPCHDDQ